MPSSAFNTTPIYKPTETNRSFFKTRKGKFFIFFVIVLLAAILAFVSVRKNRGLSNLFNNNPPESTDLINEETGELSDEGLKNITNITIEEVREASDSTGVNLLESPSLSDAETSKKIYAEIGNDNPENHLVSYNEFGLSFPYIEVKQGDTVTWVNDSDVQMNVVGEGWDSIIPREPGDLFSYGFIYLGEYKYKVNDNVEGIIKVIQ